MDIVFVPLLMVLIQIIGLYKFLLIAYIILTWLEAFGIVNRYNNLVYTIHNFLFSITEPALRPLRRILPLVGGFDLSPVTLFLILYFVTSVLLAISLKFPM